MGDPQMRKMLWVMLVLGTCLGLAGGASATLLVDDNLDYGDGALLTSNGWTAHSGGGTQPIDVFSPGLTYPGYPSSIVGQAARLDNTGEDDNRAFPAQTSGTLYYSFLLNVVTPVTGYFTHFNQSSSIFAGRVWITPATGGYNLGINNGSTAPTYPTAVYSLNTTYLVVVKFDFASGLASLFVNPAIEPCVEPEPVQISAATATGFSAIAVALRQYSATQNILLDAIHVGATWADVVCGAPPTGACCFADGTCSVLLQADCLAAGGVYRGDGTTCSPNPCPQLGTCCALDGTCTFVLEANCTGAWTLGGACDPNPCTQPVGSCCALDGSCTVTTQVNCAATWTEGGVCVPNTCPPPTGSCCDPLGTCAVTIQADCTGAWTMFGVCIPNPCPLPTGACCLPAGTCLLGTEADCAGTSGGTYQGNFTTCTPNPCAAPLRTLCEVAEDDMNGVAVLVGQRVTVEGIALCDGMTWSTTTREFQITDGTCCIDVFGGGLVPAVAMGDLVRITGTVANYNGKTEVTTPDMTVTVISSGNPLPTPGVTTTGALAAAGESFESCLFTIHCASIVSGTWPATGLDANIVIDDGSGPVTMRIDKDTNIDGSPAPVGPFTITGIGDQYDTTTPYTVGWQIKPRFLADLVFDCATGACCFPSGACLVMNDVSCASQNGSYLGDGTTCQPNNCPPPVGACCFVTGICEILPQAACQDGLWLGFGSVCTPVNPCEQPSGSCCYSDGTCEVMPQAPCTGLWTMFGVCQPNTCEPPPPPTGSCCYQDGTCAVTIQTDCTATWLLAGVCEPNTCEQPPVLGACCDHVTGNCTITTQPACGFDWLGAGVACDVTTCVPPTPTERASWGQIKNLYR